MKYSLTTTLLALTCCSLLFAWYSERSRFYSAESSWQSERQNLLHAALFLSQQPIEQEFELDDEDMVQFAPQADQVTLERQRKQDAVEHLVVYVNLENEIKTILELYMENRAEAEEVYETIVQQYWHQSGRSELETIKNQTSESEWKLSIERPAALRNWIQRFRDSQ